MYSKWIKSGFILAILLVSMVSLSMAACPWFIKNELYTAQCGVEKVVPASAGLLANDPGATAVLNWEPIDPKYGTLHVNADGSFVYNPNPDMTSGTYVQFKYNATNGACAAKYAGIAKIQVSCKCRPLVKDITLCLPTTLELIKQKIIDAGVDCIGCGAAPTALDLSQIKLIPGTYTYLLKCPGCQDASGKVTLVPGCAAQAPPLEVCAGSVNLAGLPALIHAACVGAGCGQPVLDLLNVTEENGFVSGGYYVAICNPGTECGSWARGDITVIQKCTASAPNLTICEGKKLAQVVALIDAECASDCDEGPVLDTSKVTVDATGNVTGGSYTACCYTVGTTGVRCESCASGKITVVPKCTVDVIEVDIDSCVLPEEAEAIISDANQFACGDCDLAPTIDFPDWPLTTPGGFVANGTYTFTVNCNAGGLDDCDSSAPGIVNIRCFDICLCEPVAPSIPVCPNEVDIDELKDMIDAVAKCNPLSGAPTSTCDTSPEINTDGVNVSNGYVTGGTYTVSCQPTEDCDAVVATGTVTLRTDCCKCIAVAPEIKICPKTKLDDLEDMIDEVAACDNLDNAVCNAEPKIDIHVDKDYHGYVTKSGYYTVTCLSNTPGCTNVATGTITLRTDCCTSEAYAPDICIQTSCSWKSSPYPGHWECHTYDDAYIKAKIMNPDGKSYTNDGAKCSGDCTQMTIVLPTGMDFSHLNSGQVREYTYTVECKDQSGNIVDEEDGTISVKSDCLC